MLQRSTRLWTRLETRCPNLEDSLELPPAGPGRRHRATVRAVDDCGVVFRNLIRRWHSHECLLQRNMSREHVCRRRITCLKIERVLLSLLSILTGFEG